MNFFYEFNSLVKLPYASSNTNNNLQLSVSLYNNTFTRFSTCGSIISNNENHLTQKGLYRTYNDYFANDYLWAYHDALD